MGSYTAPPGGYEANGLAMTTTQRRTAVGVGEQHDSEVGHRALPYVPALDGLRAIAVLAVILYHLELAGGRAAGGYLGVEVFFVVSGYLITGLLLKEHRTHGGLQLRQFWQRRARRLLPAAMVLIGAVCVYGALLRRRRWAGSVVTRSPVLSTSRTGTPSSAASRTSHSSAGRRH